MRHRVFGVLSLWLVLAGCSTQRATIPLIPPLIPAPRAAILWAEPFDRLSAERWRELEVKRHTRYQATQVDGRPCLQAVSQNGASILLSAVRFDPETYEWLSWAWRVDQLVEGEALERKRGSDAAARVYVYFDTPGLPWQRRNLDYVWSAHLPVGTTLPSAFSPLSKIIVVESGAQSLGEWRTVERNIEDDYQRVFGGDPPDVIAIGIMTDTDNTAGAAVAYFDDLRVSRRPLSARTASE